MKSQGIEAPYINSDSSANTWEESLLELPFTAQNSNWSSAPGGQQNLIVVAALL